MKSITSHLESYKSVIIKSYKAFFASDGSDHVSEMITAFENEVKFNAGRKYIKVTTKGTVHSFIVVGKDKDFAYGDILKAASYNAPARNFARANIFDAESYSKVSWTGAA